MSGVDRSDMIRKRRDRHDKHNPQCKRLRAMLQPRSFFDKESRGVQASNNARPQLKFAEHSLVKNESLLQDRPLFNNLSILNSQ